MIILDSSPSPELITFIYRETGGNPLFVEEIMKSLELNNALLWGEKYVTFDDEERIEIPNSIKGVVDIKMGMMELPACELLDYASVIGREFNFALLPVITGKKDDQLLDLLDDILGISIHVTEPGHFSLKVFDVSGILHIDIFEEFLESGDYNFHFDDLKEGLYIVRLTSPCDVEIEKTAIF